MFRRFLVLVVVVATLVVATTGCKASAYRPLEGLLLEMKGAEITGYQADLVWMAVSGALVAGGARWVEESTEGAVGLAGMSISTLDPAGKQLVWSLSLSAITSDGKYPLTTFASVKADQVVPYGDLRKMADELGKQVSKEFARQLAKGDPNKPPMEK